MGKRGLRAELSGRPGEISGTAGIEGAFGQQFDLPAVVDLGAASDGYSNNHLSVQQLTVYLHTFLVLN